MSGRMHLGSLRRWLLALSICACVIVSSPAAAQVADELNDLAARLQFHFYADDARALSQDLQSLAQLDAGDKPMLRNYYLAYGHMSLFKVSAASDRGAARKAASECVKHADQVLDQDRPRTGATERARIDALYGELWAIKATCLAGSLLGSAGKARDTAAELAPQSPRVRLLAAIHAAEDAKSARELEAASRQLQSATKAFEYAKPVTAGDPEWGHAEAWAWLGHIQLQRGDRLAARESIERALVLAPDYEWASRLRTQVASGR